MDVQVNAAAKVATLAGAADAPFEHLASALEGLGDDDTVRAVVLGLEGAGTAPALSPAEARWLERFSLPAVAAVCGELTGPALQLALSCDIRVCDGGSVMAGLPAGSARVLSLVGEAGCLEMLQSRLRVDAGAALRLGLVSEVAPRGKCLAAAQHLAATIASRGPIATRLAKEAIWRGREMPLEVALRFETDLTLLLQTTKDRAEGVAAFLEKRTPTFTGN